MDTGAMDEDARGRYLALVASLAGPRLPPSPPVALEDRFRELQAILRPLLADPFEGDLGTIYCRFCDGSLGGGDDLAYSPRDDARVVHAPGCPVPRREELLG